MKSRTDCSDPQPELQELLQKPRSLQLLTDGDKHATSTFQFRLHTVIIYLSYESDISIGFASANGRTSRKSCITISHYCLNIIQ